MLSITYFCGNHQDDISVDGLQTAIEYQLGLVLKNNFRLVADSDKLILIILSFTIAKLVL